MGSDRFFMVLSRDVPYDTEIATGIVKGLVANGARVSLCLWPPERGFNFRNPAARHSVFEVIRKRNPTDTISINLPRRALVLPEGTFHHCWIHDLALSGAESGSDPWESLWMWAPYWVDRYGGRHLPPATDYGQYAQGVGECEVDVAFAGILPVQYLLHPREPGWNLPLRRLCDAVCARLWSDPRIFCGREYAESLVREAEQEVAESLDGEIRSALVKHVIDRLFRFVARKRLMDHLVPVCLRRGWTLRLAGGGWNRFPEFKPFHVGELAAGRPLADFYRSSRVNLHVDGTSNVHSRLLEVLACGGFALAEASDTDGRPGGLRDYFPESVAPTFKDYGDLEAKLDYWLSREGTRREAIAEGGQLVRQEHSYTARMRTVLAAPRSVFQTV